MTPFATGNLMIFVQRLQAQEALRENESATLQNMFAA